jgi:hypothetical protein
MIENDKNELDVSIQIPNSVVEGIDFLFRKSLFIVSRLSEEFLSVDNSILFQKRFYEALNAQRKFLLKKD